MKKVLTAIFLVTALCFHTISPALAGTVIDSGHCGEKIHWSLTDDGTLTFSGEGTLYYLDFFSGDNIAPWIGKNITCLKVDEGITEIGDIFSRGNRYTFPAIKTVYLPHSLYSLGDVFTHCSSLTEIYLPDGLVLVGASFVNCVNLRRVYIPNTLSDLHSDAFWGCTSLKDIYFGGTESEWATLIRDTKIESNPTVHFNAKEDNPLIYLAPTAHLPSDWAKSEIEAALAADIVPEWLQGNWKQEITRQDAAYLCLYVFMNIIGTNVSDYVEKNDIPIDRYAFTDTSSSIPLFVNALGIMKGVGNGKFNPNGTLTRAQIAAIFTRLAKLLGAKTDGYSHSFTDVEGHWVAKELGWAVQNGVIAGVGNNKFDPDGPLTIEQAVVIAHRALKALKN